MPIYKMTAMVGVSAYTEVEANTKADALEIAQDREVVIGGARSGHDVRESWIIEEADGMAQEIEITSET